MASDLPTEEDMQQVLELTNKWRKGGLNWQLCCEKLNSQGLTTSTGMDWQAANLAAYVRYWTDNPKVAAKMETVAAAPKPEEKLMFKDEDNPVAHAPFETTPALTETEERDDRSAIRTEVLNEVAAMFLVDQGYPLPMRNKIAMSVLAVGA